MRALALVALLLAGCASPARPTGTTPSAAGSELRLQQSSGPGPRGELYTEGALAEVVAVGPDGERKTVQGNPDSPLVLRGLGAGSWTLTAALRPCDANCGTLDPPEHECSLTVQVPRGPVRIAYVVGGPCTIS